MSLHLLKTPGNPRFTMQSMKHSHLPLSLVILGITALFPGAQAHAQDGPGQVKSLSEPIVVAPLDDNSSTEPVAIKLVDALRNNGKKTLSPPQVQNLLDRHKIALNQVDTSRLGKDVESLKEGAQLYFYEGPGAAQSRIEKPLDRALSDLSAIAARKDLAEQTFESAVILLRAYHDARAQDAAQAHAMRMVKLFPSKNTSSNTTPPEIQELLDRARSELVKQNTTLQIKPFKSQGQTQTCRYFINGFEASSAEAYSVSKDQEYFLQMDCGRGANAIAWRMTPRDGEANAVPIIDVEPLQMTMQDSSFQSRTEVEQRILFVLHWTNIKTFIGVSKNGAMGTDQAALLVHVNDADRQALWSDGATQESLCTTLEAWFPGLQVNCDTGNDEPAPRPKWPLALAAAGAALGGTGTGLWLYNEREIDRIRCSPYAETGSEPCTGVDAYATPELDDVDVDALLARRNRNRTIGIGLAGGGALMLVGGLTTYFLSGGERKQAQKQDISLELVPTQGGARGSLTWRF